MICCCGGFAAGSQEPLMVDIFLNSQLTLLRQLHQPPRSSIPDCWLVLPLPVVFMG